VDLSANARQIMDLRYSRKDERGDPTETPEQVVARVAGTIANITLMYHPDAQGEREEVYKAYRDLLNDRLMFPNSPTWTGAGTPLGQLSACFVLPIDDDLGRERAGIYSTLKDAVLIQQTGGGNGFDFSRLRPANAVVSRSMGRASGPVGFLASYDAVFGTIAQGGSRRGANMAVLRCDHPDVTRFIRAKIEEGKIANFNISVAATEDFMQAVVTEAEFDLVHKGRVYETIKARDLFAEIAEDAWKFGDPGLLFIDRAERDNPCPLRYNYEATNPCGEQWLPPYGSCNLGSIALQRFVRNGQNSGEAFLYWEGLAQAIHTSVNFLDDAIDANHYVESVPELAEMALNERRIGLGYMGVADAMALLGIRYGSPDGEDFISQVTEFLRYHAMSASILRAQARGAFPWIEGSIYDPKLVSGRGWGTEVSPGLTTWSPPVGSVEHVRGWGRPVLDWHIIEEGIESYGIRNACTLTYAPTGTISNVADCEGSGIECFFALTFERKVMQEGQNIALHYASGLFEAALRGLGYDESRRQAIIGQVVAEGGSCQAVGDLPQSIRDAFVVAGDLDYQEHIRMQAAAQAWVDNSISKTINLPNSASVGEVEHAYRLAHQLGCKGITIYRQGSRSLEVLSTTSSIDLQSVQDAITTGISEYVAHANGWKTITPMPIPVSAAIEGLPTRTFPVKTGFGTLQVYVTEHPDHPGRPFDCRISVGKHGSDKNADVEALARMISIALRSGVSVAAITDQLKGIGGRTMDGFGPGKVLSVADGVGKLLERLYQPVLSQEILEAPGGLSGAPGLIDGGPMALDRGQTCPRCGVTSLVYEAGCLHCDVRFGGCGDFTRCD
jgi:ribonucleoside-diphosphate reductase alpha chain